MTQRAREKRDRAVLFIYEYVSLIYAFLILRTGWRRLIGSPKLQIIFHKRAIKYRALLRKMTYKDKGSYESSPPCTCTMRFYTWVETPWLREREKGGERGFFCIWIGVFCIWMGFFLSRLYDETNCSSWNAVTQRAREWEEKRNLLCINMSLLYMNRSFFFAPARLDIMLGLKRRDLESKRKRGGEVSFVYEYISLEYE